MPAVSAVISTGANRSRLPRSNHLLGEVFALFLHQVEVVRDEQNAVADRDAAQRDEADQAGDRQRSARSGPAPARRR